VLVKNLNTREKMGNRVYISFDLQPGRVLGGKYIVESKLGDGYEGEVYRIKERSTGAVRAAKFYYPARNEKGKTALLYAQKLDKLKNCPIILGYHHQDWVTIRKQKIQFVVSELVEGDLLCNYLEEQRGKRLNICEALHILYEIARGMEPIHRMGEYHGDIHSENIMIRQRGINYDVKLLDCFINGKPSKKRIQGDVLDMINLLYEMIGGQKFYSKMPPQIKAIVCGRKKTLIAKKFRTAGHLRFYLDNFEW
jgi:serine/threonine protein kinase